MLGKLRCREKTQTKTMSDRKMKKVRQFIIWLFGIKEDVKPIINKVNYTICDREFSEDDYKYVSDFLKSETGKRFCDFLLAQRYSVADKVLDYQGNAEYWRGYATGYKNAITHVLDFRQSDANDTKSSNSSNGVGLENLAEVIDSETER